LAWKQGILQRAVEAGFVQYQQFLPTPDTAWEDGATLLLDSIQICKLRLCIFPVPYVD
jgi:hypothetical protein